MRIEWKFLIVVMPILGGIVVATSNTDQSTAEGDGCESVPRSTLDAIEEGLTIAGGGSLTSRRALQGSDWWYVAAEIGGPGLEGSGDVGVWAMPAPGEPGPIYAAEAMAREFSQWGTAGSADAL